MWQWTLDSIITVRLLQQSVLRSVYGAVNNQQWPQSRMRVPGAVYCGFNMYHSRRATRINQARQGLITEIIRRIIREVRPISKPLHHVGEVLLEQLAVGTAPSVCGTLLE